MSQAAPPRGFRFEPVRRLGHGVSGDVWECDDPRHGRIAVKRLHTSLDADARAKLAEEYRVLANIRHPNVVRVVELFIEPEVALGMELVEGRAMLEALDDERELTSEDRTDGERLGRLLDLTLQLLDALDAVHSSGLVHRDVKPANAIVTRAGALKLLDLGLAAATQAETAGTLRYMAPEALAGRPLDHRADLYAVGVIVYEALTGDVPFGDRDDAKSFIQARVHRPAPGLRATDPTIPEPLAEVIASLLATRPDDRPATARDASRLLSTALPRNKEDDGGDVSNAIVLRQPEFVGRGHALAELSSAASAALDRGTCTAVVLTAPAGYGKRALIGRWLDGLDSSVLRLPFHGDRESSPLAGFRSVLEELVFALVGNAPAPGRDFLPPQSRCLEALCPRVRELPGFDFLPPILTVSPDEEIRRQADCLRGLLVNTARNQPVVVVAHDVDQISPASRDLLVLLAAPGDSFLFLLSTTTGELDAECKPLARSGHLTIDVLTPVESRSLITSALGAPPTNELADWLEEISGGIPGLLIDWLAAAERAFALRRLPEHVALERARTELLLAGDRSSPTLSGLSPPGIAAATATAILESVEHLDTVALVMGATIDDCRSAIDELIQRRVIRDTTVGYRIESATVRDSILAGIEAEQLRELHLRASGTGEIRTNDAAFVHHSIEAGEAESAVDRLEPAITALLARGHAERALRLAKVGLELTTNGGDDALEAAFVLHRAAAAYALGRVDERDQCLERAGELIGDGDDIAGDLYRSFVQAVWDRDHYRDANEALRPLLERFLAAAVERQDRASEAYAHHRLSTLLMSTDLTTAREHADRSVSLSLSERNREQMSQSLNARGLVQMYAGDMPGAERDLVRGLIFTRALGLPAQEIAILQNLGVVHESRGHGLEALHAYKQGKRLARKTGNRGREGVLAMNQAAVLTGLGHYGEAKTTLDEAARTLLGVDDSRRVGALGLNRGRLDLRTGSFQESIDHLDRALGRFDTSVAGMYHPQALCLRAEARLSLGDAEGAGKDIEQARIKGTEAGVDWIEAETDYLSARVAELDGRDDDLIDLVERLIPDAERRQDLVLLARARTLLARARQDLALGESAVDTAVESGDADAEIDARATFVTLLADKGDPRLTEERERGKQLVERIAARSGDTGGPFATLASVRTLRD